MSKFKWNPDYIYAIRKKGIGSDHQTIWRDWERDIRMTIGAIKHTGTINGNIPAALAAFMKKATGKGGWRFEIRWWMTFYSEGLGKDKTVYAIFDAQDKTIFYGLVGESKVTVPCASRAAAEKMVKQLISKH